MQISLKVIRLAARRLYWSFSREDNHYFSWRSSYKMYKKTVKELQSDLRKLGASVKGRKHELIERYECYMRNQNFACEAVTLPPPELPEWPCSGFKQLRVQHKENIPQLLEGHIRGYFEYRIATDSESNNDLQALTKGKSLLEAGRVEACSFNNNGASCFFSGIVRAMMKKKVTYSVRLKTEANGDITNSDCECPAGAGPHATCKHVAAMAFMLLNFIQKGKLGTQQSCTETLQTFHKPAKLYCGSPVKVEQIPSNRSFQRNLKDPRPEEYRNWDGYNDYVRNLVINYSASKRNADLSIRYLFGKADIQAAQHDHDYLAAPFTSYWIDRAVTVTQRQAQAIEKETRLQAKCTPWFANREWRLTASKFGDICHMSSRRNVEKMCNNILYPPSLKTRAVIHGRTHEVDAKRKFTEIYNLRVKECGLIIHPSHHYLAATPDGLVGNTHILEIKCPYRGREKKIEPGKDFPFIEMQQKQLVLKITAKYYDQVQGQMAVTGRSKAFFVVYTFVDLKCISVDFDEHFWTNSMLPKLSLFFDKYFKKYITSQL